MKSPIIFVAAILQILLISCDNNQKNSNSSRETDTSMAEKIDQYISAHHENNRFNGTLLISRGDSVLFSRSYGMAAREFDIKNTDTTKFLIGSVTKPFTAYAVLLLEARGELSLNEKLDKYFPDFPNADKVTIKQLLTHTSGITDYHSFKDWAADSKTDITPMQTIENVKTRPYIFQPGERFSYSNTGYILLGLIIEKVSGKSFADFIHEEIAVPLDLNRTGVVSNKKIVKGLALGYRSSPRRVERAQYINYFQPFSSGNMYSACGDLKKFTNAVINSALLPDSLSFKIFNDNLGSYGYGWGIRDFDGIRAYGHHGAMNGYSASMTYIPEGDIFLCFLTNDDSTPKYTIAEDLVSLLNGKVIQIPKRIIPVELTDEIIEEISGDYLVRKGDTLSVFAEDLILYMQETNRDKLELFPLGNNTFAFTSLEFHTVFSDVNDGKAQTLRFVGKSNLSAARVK